MNLDKTLMESLMREVIKEVDIGAKKGNSPFAAFLLDKSGKICFKAHNTANQDIDPTAHAEINLIRQACRNLGTKDLSDYILISNAWSCSMCMSAAIKAKITNFIFGAESEADMNPNVTIFDLAKNSNNKLNIITGILSDECRKQIFNYRNKGK